MSDKGELVQRAEACTRYIGALVSCLTRGGGGGGDEPLRSLASERELRLLLPVMVPRMGAMFNRETREKKEIQKRSKSSVEVKHKRQTKGGRKWYDLAPLGVPVDNKQPGVRTAFHAQLHYPCNPLVSLSFAMLTCAWIKRQVREPPQKELREPGAEHGPLHLVLPLLQGQVPKALQEVGLERRGLPPAIALHELQRYSLVWK